MATEAGQVTGTKDDFFRRAQEASRKGGEQGKALLKAGLGS